MPEESQKDLFRDLEFKMDNATDVLFYKLDDIFKQLEANAQDDRDRFIESTASQDFLGVQTYLSQMNDSLNLLDASVVRIGTRVERAIMATAPKGAEVTTDIVKAAVEENEAKKETVAQIADIKTLVKDQSPANVLDLFKTAIADKPKGNVVGEDSALPVNLAEKMGPVLDNAAVFLKNWANPERVGLALGAGLAIPIVGGIGVAAVGLYFIFDRIADAVEHISDNTTSLLKGGFKGLLFGNSEVVKTEPEKREPVAQETLDVNWLTGFGNGVNERLSEISLHTSAIQRSIIGLAAFGTTAAFSETTKKEQGEDQLQRVQYENAIAQLPIYDYTYQERILNVLTSPVQVKLVDVPTPESNKTADTVDVFANAVRPLVDGQVSLQRMLDGNLRKLTEAVASLREVPRESEDRITRITDSLNTEMSDDSVRMILSETRVISGLLSDIQVDLSGLFTAYKDNNKEESGGSVELPTPVDMN